MGLGVLGLGFGALGFRFRAWGFGFAELSKKQGCAFFWTPDRFVRGPGYTRDPIRERSFGLLPSGAYGLEVR